MAPEAAAGVLAAPRWAMQHALDDLDRAYGGVEQYLIGPAGVEPAALAALRDRLVAPYLSRLRLGPAAPASGKGYRRVPQLSLPGVRALPPRPRSGQDFPAKFAGNTSM